MNFKINDKVTWKDAGKSRSLLYGLMKGRRSEKGIVKEVGTGEDKHKYWVHWSNGTKSWTPGKLLRKIKSRAVVDNKLEKMCFKFVEDTYKQGVELSHIVPYPSEYSMKFIDEKTKELMDFIRKEREEEKTSVLKEIEILEKEGGR